MELRRRVQRLIVETPTIRRQPKKISSELASLEEMAQYQRWLRGVMSLLAFFSFVFSLVAIENFAVVLFCNSMVMVASVFGEICIYRVYRIKAWHAGVTDPIYSTKPSVLHSPHLVSMLVEMLMWMLYCPPGLASYFLPSFVYLDFLVACRLYTVLLYLNHLSFGHRTFCRAMAAIADVRLSVSFYLRTSFTFDTAKTSLCVVTLGWSCLALMFAKSEGIGFWDSMYFCFVTAATIGYGDISPKTTQGRLVAFASWVFGLTVVAWVVGLTHEALTLSDPERNLFTLFQANELCNRIPIHAAKVIQRAYRLHRGKRNGVSMLRLSYLGYKLTNEVNALRSARRQLRFTETTFMSELANFEAAPPQVDHKTRRKAKEGTASPQGSPLEMGGTWNASSFSVGDTHQSPSSDRVQLVAPRESALASSTVSYDDVEMREVAVAPSRPKPSSVTTVVVPTTLHPVAAADRSPSLAPSAATVEERLNTLESNLNHLIAAVELLVVKRNSREEVRREDSDELLGSNDF